MDFTLPALPPNVTPLTDGDPLQVGRYRLIGRLGADGMSTLFAAVSPEHEPIALKIAAAEWAPGSDASDESAPVRPADGVCAVGARDSGSHEGRPWSAIEYVPGFGLGQHVRAHGRLGGDALLVLAAGMAEALASVHAADTVHGDVRPGNVVASAEGPRVLDFGVTRRIDDAAPVQSSKSLGWLAPESYDGSAATQASDVHGWACLVVFAATGEPPFGTSPAGHTPGRIPGQILWEMARRAREARVDLRALPEELRPLLLRAFSPDPDQRPSAEDAYLECLLLLGIDEQSTAETWPDQLRALIGEHWPKPDLSWHDPIRWADAARALSEGGPQAGTGDTADGGAASGATGAAGAGTATGVPGVQGTSGMPGSGERGGASGPGGSGRPSAAAAGSDPEEEWGPEAAAEAYGHTPRNLAGGQGGAAPGMRSAGAAGHGGATYLFGPSQTGGHDMSSVRNEGIDLDEDDDGTGRKSRLGVWLGVGALGMAAALGGGYLLFDTLSGSPADTVVAEEPTEEPPGTDEADDLGDPLAPEAMACDDTERVSAQEAHAPWRPFDPEAVAPDLYTSLLTPGPEGEPNTNPDAWPFVSPLDHDTADYGLYPPGLDSFPVMSVCMTGVRDTGAGIEFTVELTYHPNVGSHRVYAEDFLTVVPLEADEHGGLDRQVIRGGSGGELGQPMNTLVVLSPENPAAEVDVLVHGAPERAGVAYRPSAFAGAMAEDLSGHCYDVDGTLEWRDEDRLGSGFFALPTGSAPGDSDMTRCPADEIEVEVGANGEAAETGGAGDAAGQGGEGAGEGAEGVPGQPEADEG
ncbi:protein kinase [Nocardiopsis exhalans]|uniref:Protein kinase n=1 Tax=Nocardiopsis exhalans TaxID=163604 RepID=A0ABY5DDK7_9ACTN|nr:protein kinase [Nocardiopsis exhalans]USY21846.1 protein kinase [Nocardiopsis exhalans]